MPADERRVTLIGAPTDVGAGVRGASMAPEALRVAGLVGSLARLKCDVEDLGNLNGPSNPERPSRDGYRHIDEVVHWCRAVHDAVGNALDERRLPILMGGDHSLAMGSIAAVARHCTAQQRPLHVLWLDAHADFNVPRSSPTGNLHGMPVAVITGHGPEPLLSLGAERPMVAPQRIVQVGVRSVDEIETALLVESGVVVYDMRHVDELRMRVVMERALQAAVLEQSHLHVSFDVDFLDPSIAPGVPTIVPGGPTYREAQLCMEMIHDTGLLGSLDIVELNPAFDERNRTAELVVELVESLFGEQILARARGHKPRYEI
jgi:arginase